MARGLLLLFVIFTGCVTPSAAHRVWAQGFQGWQCTNQGWVPDDNAALLYASTQAQASVVGWVDGVRFQWADGTGLVGNAASRRSAPAASPASLDWYEMSLAGAEGPGPFETVQRVCTSGGIPTQPCDDVERGARVTVRYSAEYVFTRAQKIHL